MLAKMIEILKKQKEKSGLSALQVIGLELTGNIHAYAPIVIDTMNSTGIRMMFLRDLPHWEHVEKLSYSEIADRMNDVLIRWHSKPKPKVIYKDWRLRWSWKIITDMLTKTGLPQEYRALKIGDGYNYAGVINQAAFGTPYLFPLPVVQFASIAFPDYGIIPKLVQYNERKFTFGEMAEMIEFQFCDNSLFTQTFDFTYRHIQSDW